MKRKIVKNSLSKRQIEVKAAIKHAERIRERIAKDIQVPDDFDVVKFIHENR